MLFAPKMDKITQQRRLAPCTLMISPVMVRNIIAEGVAVSSYTHRGLFSEKYKIIK